MEIRNGAVAAETRKSVTEAVDARSRDHQAAEGAVAGVQAVAGVIVSAGEIAEMIAKEDVMGVVAMKVVAAGPQGEAVKPKESAVARDAVEADRARVLQLQRHPRPRQHLHRRISGPTRLTRQWRPPDRASLNGVMVRMSPSLQVEVDS